MDKTLREYLAIADDMLTAIHTTGIAIKTDNLERSNKELKLYIKNIQAITKRMADVANIYNRAVLHRKKQGITKQINTYPTENDHAVLRLYEPIEKKNIVADIALPIKTVEKCCEIPVSNIYYVNELKQYVINVAGVNIKGNLANINKYKTAGSARCEHGIQCKSFKNSTTCNYYHDPEDYIKLKLPVPDNNTRTFTTGSWFYSKNKNPRTYFTRHIGSKDSLIYDLHTLKSIQYIEEVYNREGQLMHDLLMYMILHSEGLLERYPHWQKMK